MQAASLRGTGGLLHTTAESLYSTRRILADTYYSILSVSKDVREPPNSHRRQRRCHGASFEQAQDGVR